MEKYKRTFLEKIFGLPNKQKLENAVDYTKQSLIQDLEESLTFSSSASHMEMMEGAESVILSSEEIDAKIKNILFNPQKWTSLKKHNDSVERI